MVRRIGHLLRDHGHNVHEYFRSSSELNGSWIKQAKAFFSGIFSYHSRYQVRQVISDVKPDIVHIQNLYPLISPSVLLEAAQHNVHFVMRCANYRLVCPNGLFLRDDHICEDCSGGREWRCVVHNCENNIGKSLGYALRNYVARTRRYYLDNVTFYIALTEFQKKRLIEEGFPADRICVIPNMADSNGSEQAQLLGDYVGFVGRISPEKGISTLVKAAELCREIQFKAAGSYDRFPEIVKNAPGNFDVVGHLDKPQLKQFYADSRIIILCSICYEGFPSVLLEAMLHGKPVICSRIGGLPEIVDEGETGLLFEPGNAEDLAEKVHYLWNRKELCRQMGQAGREKVLREYSADKYYERLMKVYKKAIEFGLPAHRSRY